MASSCIQYKISASIYSGPLSFFCVNWFLHQEPKSPEIFYCYHDLEFLLKHSSNYDYVLDPCTDVNIVAKLRLQFDKLQQNFIIFSKMISKGIIYNSDKVACKELPRRFITKFTKVTK